VLHGLGAEHEVECAVVERQRGVGLQLHEARAGEPAPRALERDRRDVGRRELRRV
jgi:hypothetical protein